MNTDSKNTKNYGFVLTELFYIIRRFTKKLNSKSELENHQVYAGSWQLAAVLFSAYKGNETTLVA